MVVLSSRIVSFTNSGILTVTTPALAVEVNLMELKTNPDGMTLLEASLDAGSTLGLLQLKFTQEYKEHNAWRQFYQDADGQSVTYSEVTSVLTSNANTPAQR